MSITTEFKFKAAAAGSMATALALLSTPVSAQPPVCTPAGLTQPCVTGADIGFNVINSSKILNNTLRSIDMRDGEAVGGIDVIDNSLTAADLAPNSVGASELGPDSVTSADIIDGQVTSADVANESLTSSDLGPNSVGASEITNNSVGSAEIANGSITGLDIQDGQIGTNDIQNGGVRGTDILDNDVTTNDIRNNSIQDIDILDEAGADFLSGNQLLALNANDTAVRTVSITAPTSGRVIANASGYFDFNTTGGVDVARCSITTGTVIDFTHLIITGEISGTDMNWVSFAGTRAFNVGPGTTTFRLVCDEFTGNVSVGDSSLNAIFVSTNY